MFGGSTKDKEKAKEQAKKQLFSKGHHQTAFTTSSTNRNNLFDQVNQMIDQKEKKGGFDEMAFDEGLNQQANKPEIRTITNSVKIDTQSSEIQESYLGQNTYLNALNKDFK